MFKDTKSSEPGKTSLNSALILSKICVPLILVQSIIGLLVPGTYIKDGAWGKAVWLGNDFVNLFIFIPLYIIALIFIKRGTDRGMIFWLGIQALITYDYLYYPLAVVYNNYFLLYVAILGLSFYSFISGITKIDFSAFEKYIPGKKSRIFISVLMLAFTLILALMWIGMSVYYIFTGVVKQQGISMIATFDLIIIVTPVILATIWLLKRQARGYVFMTIMSITCGFYCFILIAFTPFALQANLADAWTMLPVWITLCVLCLPVIFMLLHSKPKTATGLY